MNKKNKKKSKNDPNVDALHHIKINLHSASIDISNNLTSISNINGAILSSNITDFDGLGMLQIDALAEPNLNLLSTNVAFNLKNETELLWNPTVVDGLNVSQGRMFLNLYSLHGVRWKQSCGANGGSP